MLHIKQEGMAPKQGLSFYHPQDPSSIGVFFRIGNHVWRLRWSKKVKQLFKGYDKIDYDAIKKLEQMDV